MKFITEIELQTLYKDEPFTSYQIKPGTKLTPGARQFLIDKRIDIRQAGPENKENISQHQEKSKDNWKKKKLLSKLKSTEAIFLVTAEDLLDVDILLSQKIIELSSEFTNIKNALEGKGSIKDLKCDGCEKINKGNFSKSLGDCFPITGFHIQLDKGKEIIRLHRLRCALYEVEPAILEFYHSHNEEDLCLKAIEKLNQIINTLSQIICFIVGGKRCQRKD